MHGRKNLWKNGLASDLGSCLDPELFGTGPELRALEEGGQAETGPGPHGVRVGAAVEIHKRGRKHDWRLCHASSRRDTTESVANRVRTL
jgi:hypothetical protein